MTETNNYVPRLQKLYKEEVSKQLQEKFGYSNPMQIPKLTKIVVNMGVGEGSRDAKIIDRAQDDLTLITGQRARRNNARISVAQFKVREGMPVGCSVTLRGQRMWDFLERLIVTAIPRIRDFRGLPRKAFDGRGNYNFGLREHQVFLELSHQTDILRLGMDLAFVTTAQTDEECRELIKGLGLPLREQ